jgi:hypothetical protein
LAGLPKLGEDSADKISTEAKDSKLKFFMDDMKPYWLVTLNGSVNTGLFHPKQN